MKSLVESGEIEADEWQQIYPFINGAGIGTIECYPKVSKGSCWLQSPVLGVVARATIGLNPTGQQAYIKITFSHMFVIVSLDEYLPSVISFLSGLPLPNKPMWGNVFGMSLNKYVPANEKPEVIQLVLEDLSLSNCGLHFVTIDRYQLIGVGKDVLTMVLPHLLTYQEIINEKNENLGN